MAIPNVNNKTTLFFAALVIILLGIMIFVNRNRISFFSNKPSYQMEIQKIQNQSKSTELDEIEEDLEETDVENVDKELQDIEYEIDQVYN